MKNFTLISLFVLLAASENAWPLFDSSEIYPAFRVNDSAQRRSLGVDLVEAAKEDFAKKFEGQKLNIEIEWDKSNINAYATIDWDDNPVIKITGGMAGHEFLTRDGLGLVICHELGHFLGGSPKKLRGRSGKKSWSSAEGQADYYAASSCLKKLLNRPDGFTFKERFDDAAFIPPEIVKQAADICRDSLCEKMALAAYSLARVYAEVKFYNRELSLVRNSENRVEQTLLSHPDPQCRLDTMLGGLLGRRRPLCWYAP